jgi:hypothetical protein
MKMKKEMSAWNKRFNVPDFGPREILKFHAQQGLELRAGKYGRYSGDITWGLGVYSEDLLRLWQGLSCLGNDDLKLLLLRYGFSNKGPQSLRQIARARGCDEKTIRLKLRRIEAGLKERLLSKRSC